MAYLVFIQKGQEVQRMTLDKPITVGRSLECDIWFDDRKLSRKHCRLEKIQKDWVVTDLGSHNGMTVRGEKVPRQVLVDGDVIEIGSYKITFHSDSLVPKRPTMPVREDRLPIEEELLRLKAGNAPSRPLPNLPTMHVATGGKAKEPGGSSRQPTRAAEQAASADTSVMLPAVKKQPKSPITLAFRRPPAQPIVHGSQDLDDGLSPAGRKRVIVAAGAVAVALMALLVYVVI